MYIYINYKQQAPIPSIKFLCSLLISNIFFCLSTHNLVDVSATTEMSDEFERERKKRLRHCAKQLQLWSRFHSNACRFVCDRLFCIVLVVFSIFLFQFKVFKWTLKSGQLCFVLFSWENSKERHFYRFYLTFRRANETYSDIWHRNQWHHYRTFHSKILR